MFPLSWQSVDFAIPTDLDMPPLIPDTPECRMKYGPLIILTRARSGEEGNEVWARLCQFMAPQSFLYYTVACRFARHYHGRRVGRSIAQRCLVPIERCLGHPGWGQEAEDLLLNLATYVAQYLQEDFAVYQDMLRR